MREALGRLFNRLHIPGSIAPMNYKDIVTGDAIDVTVSPLFVRLSINGRDYYFDRFNGRFDGTGMGCR